MVRPREASGGNALNLTHLKSSLKHLSFKANAFFSHKIRPEQCKFSHFKAILLCFTQKTYTLARLKPGSNIGFYDDQCATPTGWEKFLLTFVCEEL
jgi:hypothetical protein